MNISPSNPASGKVPVLIIDKGSTTPRLTYVNDPHMQPYTMINRSGIPYGILKRLSPLSDEDDDY